MKYACLVLLIVLLTVSVNSADYTIDKVVEVGPGRAALIAPLQWSPNGSQLAYFIGHKLYVADTLGHSQYVADIDMQSYNYKWLSDREIIVATRGRRGEERVGYSKLHRIDIETGANEVLEDCVAHMIPAMRKDDTHRFYGPFISLEGNVFYTIRELETARLSDPKSGRSWEVENGNVSDTEVSVFLKSHYVDKGDALLPENNHFARWGDDGLYFVRCDFQDSVRMTTWRPWNYYFGSPQISKDHKYYMMGSIIYQFADTTYHKDIVSFVPTIYPLQMGGAIDYAFNSKMPEVILTGDFSTDEKHVITRIITFNYATDSFTIIDDMIGIYGCEWASYSPDGEKIALWANKKIYIIYRKWE